MYKNVWVEKKRGRSALNPGEVKSLDSVHQAHKEVVASTRTRGLGRAL